jgi:hypothetical protein
MRKWPRSLLSESLVLIGTAFHGVPWDKSVLHSSFPRVSVHFWINEYLWNHIKLEMLLETRNSEDTSCGSTSLLTEKSKFQWSKVLKWSAHPRNTPHSLMLLSHQTFHSLLQESPSLVYLVTSYILSRTPLLTPSPLSLFRIKGSGAVPWEIFWVYTSQMHNFKAVLGSGRQV